MRPEIRIGDNVFLIPEKNARSITGWLIVLAGCADEADGQCVGTAHFLEHLLFINRDEEHSSKVAFFADGSGNGWTTHRTTSYFQRFPSRTATNQANLEKLIGHFAGLLTEVRVTPEQAQRERNVVLQEYQQNTGRNPFARFSVSINAALMPNEPLGQRVIGSPETIAGFTTEAARAFHARWYSSSNAFIVLHGPIERSQVAALVARHIAPLPAKPVPPHAWKSRRNYEPGTQMLKTTENDSRQTAVYLERIVTFDEPPAVRDATDASAGVLASFLASRLKESPLETLMERDELITGGRLSISRVREGTFRLSFFGTPASGIPPERVIEAARAYITGLAATGLSQETVDRLKQRIANERALLEEQPGLYAQALTNWLSGHGTYDSWRNRRTHAAAVTRESIDRLLAVLAGPAREVTGVLLPGTNGAAGTARRPSAEAPTLPGATNPLSPTQQ